MNSPDLLSPLPTNWKLIPIKSACHFAVSNVDKHVLEDEIPVRLCNYTDVYNNERVSPEMNLMSATATEDEIRKFHLEPGDVVITKDSESWDDIGIPAYVEGTADDFICGYHLALIRPNKNVLDGRFLFRCIQSRPVALQLELDATGVTRYGLPKSSIGNALIPLPPLETQRRIADYLDRETARIDALIAEKEKMLALLEEKRTALISRAVTRGLDPNAPLKPSGLDWLGDIPAHWEVRRCATIFREIDERGEPNLPLLNVSLNTGVTRRLFSEDKIESVAADFSTYKIARKGMLVFNKMRFWQGAAGIAPIDGLTSPDYTVAEIIDAVLPKYIEYVVRLPQFNNEVRRYSYGMVDDRLRLYWDSFKNIRLPMPPIDEQNRILDYLDKELSGIGEVSASIKTSLSLIKERRAALITAAVTGQLDLKELAA